MAADDWDRIAPLWDRYRQTPMKEVLDFLSDKHGSILDLGCGSGRHFIRGLRIYGIDHSERMIELAKDNARKKGIDAVLKVADLSKLPFDDNFFDSAICAAVIHGMPRDKRRAALLEIKRVLKPESSIIISVWYHEQKGDRHIPWKVGDKVVHRFYHFFSQQELIDEIEAAGLFVSKSWLSEGREKNIFVLAKKPF
jgi:ubiquinone/menaquinone biosynthesis C-methylase UbiE